MHTMSSIGYVAFFFINIHVLLLCTLYFYMSKTVYQYHFIQKLCQYHYQGLVNQDGGYELGKHLHCAKQNVGLSVQCPHSVDDLII